MKNWKNPDAPMPPIPNAEPTNVAVDLARVALCLGSGLAIALLSLYVAVRVVVSVADTRRAERYHTTAPTQEIAK